MAIQGRPAQRRRAAPTKAHPGNAWRGSKQGNARRRKRIHARMAREGVDKTTVGHLRRHRPEKTRQHLLPKRKRPTRSTAKKASPARRPAKRTGTAAVSSVARHGGQSRRASPKRVGRSRPQPLTRNLRQARRRRSGNTSRGGSNRGGRQGAGGTARRMQLKRRNLQRRRTLRRAPPSGRRQALRGTQTRYAARHSSSRAVNRGPAARLMSQRTGLR